MFRPLDEFAGWLRFFYFIVFINLILNFVFGVTIIEELFTKPDKILTLASIVQWVFILLIFYLIIKIIQKREADVPENIKDYLFYIFVIAIIHFVFNTAVTLIIYKRSWNSDNTMAFVSAIRNMIWTAIWRSYFEYSKRVKAYYKTELKDVDILV